MYIAYIHKEMDRNNSCKYIMFIGIWSRRHRFHCVLAGELLNIYRASGASKRVLISIM